jgi:hypothetical protein
VFSLRTIAAALVVSGSLASSVPAATPHPPQTVRATLIKRTPNTLAPGSPVRSASVVGQRVFTDARHGFALASVRDADYPVATADAGKTWKTAGPALHLHAAQAPLAVEFIGAVNRRTIFAWGGGQVIDATRDGGKHWYRALFGDGEPVGVVPDLSGHLLAFVASSSGSASSQYVSKDGGRTWRRGI